MVTFTSSTAAVGEVKTTTAHGATVTVSMPANTSCTPASVASGGVAFDPVGGGTTTVKASAPGFAAFSTASQTVTVSQPAINVTDVFVMVCIRGTRVGGGLQDLYRVTLGGANHGGVTVRIQSSDAAVALVAPDGTTPGSAAIDVTLPDGQTTYDFYVQGVSGATGTAVISASQALFVPGAT